METVNHSYRSLRRAIGILGITLPIMLIIGNHGEVGGSISFYYYTKMSTVFTGILITFGLILITYRGTDTTKGITNENVLTNMGGIFALLVALVPTKYGNNIEALFYAHNDNIRGWIHNGSAVLFIFFMGLVVMLKFGKARYFRRFYKILGGLVMVGLAFAIFSFIFDRITGQPPFKGAIFWGETFALWAFGIAWLRRGIPKKTTP
ncbi:MAG: hypothetical protein KAR17_18435 [Cyclobacteriaceae bacterium]|nr:hypothetical protein [Cyclobacteriaceae bacterium]